jgi:hypothetical protein
MVSRPYRDFTDFIHKGLKYCGQIFLPYSKSLPLGEGGFKISGTEILKTDEG